MAGKKNVALVLSGGGARGFAHIGAINTLVKEGYNITSLSGTSMGALVGGMYAAGGLNGLEEFACTLDITEVLKLSDFSLSSKGLLKGKKIIERLKTIVPDRNIEELSIPFCAVATNILTGKEEVFSSGSLYDAIRASIAIPTVFQPFKVGDNYYVDGGVVNPVPLNRVKRHDGDLLFVVDVNSQIPYSKKRPESDGKMNHNFLKQLSSKYKKTDDVEKDESGSNFGLFNLATRSLFLMINRISELTINQCGADLIINISHDSFGVYDFYKAKQIIEEGTEAAEKALAECLHKDLLNT